ncbi:MAG: hypothetical protein H6618_04415 [Deltaproteobacteria bacterium]|nr:hypothetical protein [Deltaproteobacteria bacterium]
MNTNINLYQRLASIGINVNSENTLYVFSDIELTLILAIKNISDDKRLLGLILSWVKIHGDKINIERLSKISGNKAPPWLGLIALFGICCKQYRWKKIVSRPDTLLTNGNPDTNKARAKLKGEEEWSKGSGYLIPKGSESITDKYVLAPEQLAKINKHYKNKLIYGPNWRADIATAIESGAKNPYQVAKICHCSYEPAHRVYKDFITAGIIAKTG